MPEPRRQIGFAQVGLGTALKHNLLVVPPNQREYAWTHEEVTQMLQDFAKALNEGTDYFLGTVVTIPQPDGTLEVADGQQRLATSALLLAAIRDYLGDKNEPIIVQSIDGEFLNCTDRANRARVPRLQLNIDDNDLFKSIVAGEGFDPKTADTSRPSHDRLVRAYVGR